VSTAAFVLIHGAGDAGWYWHLVEQELRQRGYDTVAPDLPCDDDSAGLAEYADTVLEAIGGRHRLIVAAQSFGGFTAPLIAARVPVDLLVLVAGMIPAPGEAPADWSANTGFDAVMGQQAQRYSGQDLVYQDVPPALAEQARRHARDQSATPGHAPWPLDAWPPVPAGVLAGPRQRLGRAHLPAPTGIEPWLTARQPVALVRLIIVWPAVVRRLAADLDARSGSATIAPEVGDCAARLAGGLGARAAALRLGV
jgi:Alpha/beta hydrolase family